MTRRAAGIEGPPWGPDAAEQTAALFNSLAPEWHTRESEDRTAIVGDAFDRGLDALMDPSIPTPDVALELGSGLGTYSGLVARRFGLAFAVELSEEMHRRAHRTAAHRLLADGSTLPVRSASLGAVVLVNCFLFPTEIDRVLAPGGTIVWVNSSGESTPIHLSTHEVVDALPFEVSGVEARAGMGTWCALRRLA
ncbi:MAG: class I SAM-dependent methyltransferase [Microthrixaceae bacterium]|nr:class I SAM-dependent methyltransferase [Microthrixaceae bacterium]